MTLASRALRNSAFGLGGAVFSIAASTLVSAVVARSLGPARMGDFIYAFWWATVLSFFATLGLPALLTKYVAEYVARAEHATAGHIVRRTVGVEILAGLVASVAIVPVLHWWWRDAEWGVIAAAAALVLPMVVQQSAAGAVAGLQRYDRLFRISLAAAITKIVLVFVMLAAHAGTAGMLAVFVGGSIVEAGLTLLALQRWFRSNTGEVSEVESASVFRRLRRLAAVATFVSLSDAIVWERSEAYFLKRYARPRDLADYGIAFELARKAAGMGALFANVLLPMGCEAFARGGERELRRVYNQSLKFVAIAMCPIASLGICFAPQVVALIYGPAYLPAVKPLQVLLAGMPIIALAQVGEMVVYAKEEQVAFAWLAIPFAILNIVLAVLFVSRWGAVGAAVANTASQVAAVVFGMAYMERMIAVRGFPWRSLVHVALAAVVCTSPVVVAITSAAGLAMSLAALAVAAVLYLLLLAALREISAQDVRVVREAFGQPLAYAAAAKGNE